MSKSTVADRAVSRNSVVNEIDHLRELVVAARSNPGVWPDAEKCLAKLNDLYARDKAAFTAEDVRWANVLRGYLAQRLAAHQPKPKVPYAPKAKRKGDTLTHCWRCETPVDERFTEICPECSETKGYQWRKCPVCAACGCQRAGTVLV